MPKRINISKKSIHESGKIIIPAHTKPWPHELRVAHILANAGYDVEFIPEHSNKTPDIYLNRTMFEIKSPVSNRTKAIERNITKAITKCPNVIFDSSRMKLDDYKILHELVKRRKEGKGLKKLLLIDKKKKISDIELFLKNKKDDPVR